MQRNQTTWQMLDISVWQSAGTLALFPKRQIAVVLYISHRIDRPSLLIWEDDHPSSRSRLEVINEHLAIFKALGPDSRREQWSFHNYTRLFSKFSDSSSHSRRFNLKSPCMLAHERLGLFLWHPASCHDPQQSLDNCMHVWLTPSPSSIRFLIA